jgi:hypothetical protein
LAGVRDRVIVKVWDTGCEFANITVAVIIAVGLRWVRDSGTVVAGIAQAITISIEQ